MHRSTAKGHALLLIALFVVACPSASAQIGTVRFEHLTINDGLSQSSVNALLEDRQGFLWVGTQDGLNRFDGYDFVVFRNDINDSTALSSSNISSLHLDREGFVWVGTQNGTIHRYNRDHQVAVPVAAALSQPQHTVPTLNQKSWYCARSATAGC